MPTSRVVMDTNVDAEFSEFVVRRSPDLFRVAYALTGGAQAAEDLVLRALAKAFVRWRRKRGEAEPYVKRIIYRSSASGWRHRGTDRIETATLRSALLALPPRQKAVLVLRYLEDRSIDETAEILGLRPGIVASQASRALAELPDLTPDRSVDTVIREGIHDLAAEGALIRPEERDRRRFALDATDRGYQHRNRRRAGFAGAVVLVIALGLGVPYGLTLTRGDGRGIDPGADRTADITIGPDGVPTHTITDKTRPIELVDGWYVTGHKYVLDWPNMKYRRISGDYILLSPNGEWVVATDAAVDYSFTYRVTSLRTGDTQNYVHRRVLGLPQWSPDGNRLLVTKTQEGEPSGPTLVAVMLDVRTGTTTATMLDVTGLNCDQLSCSPTWLPSGTEIALTVWRKAAANQPPVQLGVQTFSLDGTRARSLPIVGTPGGPESWSPDGRHAVVYGVTADGNGPEGQLVEVATGTVVRRMGGFVIQTAWVDNGQMLVWELDFKEADKPAIVVTLQTRGGDVLQRWHLSAEVVQSLGLDGGGPLAVRPGT